MYPQFLIPNKIRSFLNDLNMFTAKVSRQYKRLNDPLRLNRTDGEPALIRKLPLMKFTTAHTNWAPKHKKMSLKP